MYWSAGLWFKWPRGFIVKIEELKSEIAAKIEANGAQHYSLKVVEKGASADGKVVGSCEAGTKDIVYKRG